MPLGGGSQRGTARPEACDQAATTLAEAKVEHIKVIEKAKRDALLNHNEEWFNQLSAVEKRLITKECKRQQNIEQVVTHAVKVISPETEVSSEKVDPDWITRFFDIVQDISNEQMQALWGRVLAGEVKQPKSFSLRTLEALRNITSEEAQLFENMAPYTLYSGSYFIYNNTSVKKNDFKISYEDVARLIEIGLVQPGSMVTQNYYNNTGVILGLENYSFGNVEVKEIIFEEHGNSYEIRCSTEGCIKMTFRGI